MSSKKIRKPNLSAAERKKQNRERRRAKEAAVLLASSLTFTDPIDANASVDCQPGTFFTPTTAQIVPEQHPDVRHVDEVVDLSRPLDRPIIEISGMEGIFHESLAQRTYDDAERARMRLATLERVLLRDLNRSKGAPETDPLYEFHRQLTRVVFEPNAEQSLDGFILGRAYLRKLSRRLEEEPQLDQGDAFCPSGSEPFALYEPSGDGKGVIPTLEGIEAWAAMRHRLIRGKSELSRQWRSYDNWSPWGTAPRKTHPKSSSSVKPMPHRAA